ncbi:hypothetical protein [Variovorax sp. RA8]|uniref:hypothetical protein n=1 Tax=Variovorax sp. (strain JCM 16519 / RA8) TaxID=662548 RepID=UPI0013A583A7|nr:hypothetical protein [Variovorax sp. RA8]
MHRPIKLTPDGATATELHRLHKELAHNLTAHGEHFFKSGELMDVLGLAHTPEETREAMSCLLSMTKELRAMNCQLLAVGFKEIDRRREIFAFTYCVQSIPHDNDPLMVNECFKLEVPLFLLATETARILIHAYKARPVADILNISKGL